MQIKTYNRTNAVLYAKKWAFSRNPAYYNFDNIGGDYTNYVSQCIYAGCNIMNYEMENSWYYNNINDRAPAWTSVEYLYNFLTKNSSYGPYGRKAEINKVDLGDIVQFKFNKQDFSHTAIITKIDSIKTLDKIFVCSHTIDSFDRRISTYKFSDIRFIHIEKIRV